MKFHSPHADVFVPHDSDVANALECCTHLTIGTHPDDVELLGMHGIHICYDSLDNHFVGVVLTNGAGSPRSGAYADVSDEQMVEIRRQEQIHAAKIGKYSAQIQLLYPSHVLKEAQANPIADIKSILLKTTPHTLYLHNPLDRHDSHRAALRTCIAALRELKPAQRPQHIFGVEVWRSLDFLPESLRIALPTDKVKGLSEKLIQVFESQVFGGKRYDLAFVGRTVANATFAESHHVDQASALSFALDLSPLVEDETLDQDAFARNLVQRLMDQI